MNEDTIKDNYEDSSIELDFNGEESEEELKIDYLNKLSDVVTWSTDWTIQTLTNQIERGNIDLNPRFQRRDAWNPKKKSRLIESMIYGLPIPQIVLAEDKRKKRFIIVDGKQRLLTLQQFCSDKIDVNKRLSLRGLFNTSLNGLTYDLLQERYQPLFENFLNQSIRSVIIKNWPSENFLYTIFFRLNTGSLGLSPQELRRALHPGPFMDFVDDFSQSSEPLKGILNLIEPDYRMRDIDLVIRYYAFRNNVTSYKGDYKPFLDNVCEEFSKLWNKKKELVNKQAEELNGAIELLIELFGKEHVFRRWKNGKYESRINRAIFDVFVYYVAGTKNRALIKRKKELIKKEFKKLCEQDSLFIKSISSNTNNLIETSTRFVIWGRFMNKIDPSIKVPNNLKNYFKGSKGSN
jgi:hypothetical protein